MARARAIIARGEDRGAPVAEIVAELAALDDAPAAITEGLQAGLRVRAWDDLQVLVLAAVRRPSTLYVPALLAILSEFSDDMTNEDVLDVLWELKDPRALPVLRRGLSVDLESDEYGNLAVKCLDTIVHTAPDSCEEILNEALTNKFESVRRCARRHLARR